MNLIKELPVKRDEWGSWTHPEYSKFFAYRDCVPLREFDEWLSTMGMDYRIVELEYDDDSPAKHRVFELGDPDFHDWVPSRPEGDGWFIVSIQDTEEGPVCIWIRHMGGDA